MKSNLKQSVAAQLRAAREKAKMRQCDVAEAMKSSRQNVGGIESGAQNLSLETIENFAAAVKAKKIKFEIS
ncbi:MAG: helix-turn-helix transcriptional regulator [Bacteroidetes bacterium]|nr:helix-turn-helix transcriptional regulator [Bacteroidota bacterium]